MKAAKVSVMVLAGALLMMQGEVRAAPMGTAFTYQGHLEDGGSPVTDTCDFEFSLWDALAGGNEKGDSPQSAAGVAVEDGLFTVTIDFDSGAFNGEARWLGIKVCCPSTTCSLEALDPRVRLTPAPHALRALEGVGPPNAIEVDLATGNVGIGTASIDSGVRLQVAGGNIKTDNQLISTVATGTAPLEVSSSTKVTSLNADRVDGSHGCTKVAQTTYSGTGDTETASVSALCGGFPKGCTIRLISTSEWAASPAADNGEAFGFYNQNWFGVDGGWRVVAMTSASGSVYTANGLNGDATSVTIMAAGSCTLVDDTATYQSDSTWVVNDSSGGVFGYACYVYVCD